MWRSYVRTAAMTAGSQADSPLFLLDYALRLLRVLVLIALWRTIFADQPPEALPMSLAAVLTYTLIAEVFAEQLNVRTTLVDAFWEGNVVLRFLRPMGLVRQFAAEMAGRWAVHFALFSVPLLLLAPLLGVDPRPASPTAGLLFIVSLGLGILVGLALELVFATFTVGSGQNPWIADYVRTALATLLSGALLPLAYYPWGLGQVFSWLPFAAAAWAPLAIYTGVGDPTTLLVTQVGWIVVLWPLANRLWQANRENIVGYGG
jgi:ABC-2 type transport system permease protein